MVPCLTVLYSSLVVASELFVSSVETLVVVAEWLVAGLLAALVWVQVEAMALELQQQERILDNIVECIQALGRQDSPGQSIHHSRSGHQSCAACFCYDK